MAKTEGIVRFIAVVWMGPREVFVGSVGCRASSSCTKLARKKKKKAENANTHSMTQAALWIPVVPQNML